MTTLFIVNHPPYGTEHAFNAVRLANAMAGREDQTVRVGRVGALGGMAPSRGT